VRVQEKEGQRAGAVHRQAAVINPRRRLRGRRVGGLALLVAAWFGGGVGLGALGSATL